MPAFGSGGAIQGADGSQGFAGSNAQNWRLLDIVRINVDASTEAVIRGIREATMIIVSVKAGSLDLWFGDQTGRTFDPPDLHFGQTNRPVQVFLPGGFSDITWRADAEEDPVLATLLIGGP